MSTDTSIKSQVYSTQTNDELNTYRLQLEAKLPKSKPEQINFLIQEILQIEKEYTELKNLEKKTIAFIAQNDLELEKLDKIRERATIIIKEKKEIAIKEKNIAQMKEEKRREEERMLQSTRTFIRTQIGEEVLKDSSFISSSDLSVLALDDIQPNFEKECLSIGDEGMRMIVKFLQSNKITNVNLYEFKDEFRENSLIIFFSALPTTKVASVGILPEQINLVSKGLKLSTNQTTQLQKTNELPYKGIVIRVK